MNDPGQLLSIFLKGTLGRSGRKRARKAVRFVTGNRGLVTASGLLAAAGVAWGIFDSLKSDPVTAPVASGAAGGSVAPPPVPVAAPPAAIPPEVLRIVRLAVSAARADGVMSPPERTLILEHARRAGVEAEVAAEIERPHPLADIVRGVSDDAARRDLYALAFAIVRADETVSGGERIYLAQLAHQLGLDKDAAARIEDETGAGIDQTLDPGPPTPEP